MFEDEKTERTDKHIKGHCIEVGSVKLFAFNSGVLLTTWYTYIFRKKVEDGTRKKIGS